MNDPWLTSDPPEMAANDSPWLNADPPSEKEQSLPSMPRMITGVPNVDAVKAIADFATKAVGKLFLDKSREAVSGYAKNAADSEPGAARHLNRRAAQLGGTVNFFAGLPEFANQFINPEVYGKSPVDAAGEAGKGMIQSFANWPQQAGEEILRTVEDVSGGVVRTPHLSGPAIEAYNQDPSAVITAPLMAEGFIKPFFRAPQAPPLGESILGRENVIEGWQKQPDVPLLTQSTNLPNAEPPKSFEARQAFKAGINQDLGLIEKYQQGKVTADHLTESVSRHAIDWYGDRGSDAANVALVRSYVAYLQRTAQRLSGQPGFNERGLPWDAEGNPIPTPQTPAPGTPITPTVPTMDLTGGLQAGARDVGPYIQAEGLLRPRNAPPQLEAPAGMAEGFTFRDLTPTEERATPANQRLLPPPPGYGEGFTMTEPPSGKVQAKQPKSFADYSALEEGVNVTRQTAKGPVNYSIGQQAMGLAGIGLGTYGIYKLMQGNQDDAGRAVGLAALGILASGRRGGEVPKDIPVGDLAKGIETMPVSKPNVASRMEMTFKNASLENPIRMFERLGNWAKQTFYYPIVDADLAIAKEHKAISQTFRQTLKDNGIGFFNAPKASERIMAYAVSRQKGGLDVLKEMGVETPTLTAGEMNAYNYMRTVYENLYKRLQVARQEAGLKPFGYVDNYFTWFRNLQDLEASGKTFNMIAPNEVTSNFLPPSATGFRFAKSRVPSKVAVYMDSFGTFDRYSQSALKHINYSPNLARMQKALLATDSKGQSLWQSNPQAYWDVKQYMDFLAGRTETPNVLTRGLRRLTRNVGVATMAYNLSSMAVQASSFVPAFAQMGPRWAMEGVKGLLDPKTRRMAFEKSHHLPDREYDISAVDAVNSLAGRYGSVKGKIANAGMKPLAWTDLQTATAAWIGFYKKAVGQLKMPEMEAIRYADDWTIKTQGSGALRDLAPIQRTTAGRAITQFQTFAINQFGNLKTDIFGVGTNMTAAQRASTAARFFIAAQIANSFYEDVLDMNSPFPNPLERFLKTGSLGQAGAEILSGVPVLGSMKYGQPPVGAVGSLLGKASQLVTNPSLGNAVGVAGRAVGVPGTRQIEKSLKGGKPEPKPKPPVKWKRRIIHRGARP